MQRQADFIVPRMHINANKNRWFSPLKTELKKIAFIIAVLVMPVVSFAQKEASNWYFGRNAGIHFNDDGSVVPLPGGQTQTNEGCSTISDTDGNLLPFNRALRGEWKYSTVNIKTDLERADAAGKIVHIKNV